MNERIWELAKKAGINLTPAQFSGVLEDEVDEFTLEDFAELIVKECVKFCEHESNDDEHDEYDMGMWVKAESIKKAIKQHFGVEE